MKKEMADNLTPEQVKEVSSFLWKKPGLETRPHALALTSNALVIAGKTIRKEGVDGFVQLVNPADGATLSQTALPAPVIHQDDLIHHPLLPHLGVSLTEGLGRVVGGHHDDNLFVPIHDGAV